MNCGKVAYPTINMAKMNCSNLEEILMKSDCDDSDAYNDTSLEDDVSEGIVRVAFLRLFLFINEGNERGKREGEI